MDFIACFLSFFGYVLEMWGVVRVDFFAFFLSLGTYVFVTCQLEVSSKRDC